MEGDSKIVSKDIVRMCGFLEKKGKMKLMNQWKKYWFVLEERLLLYYRSEIEYTNLSPCRGSLNMGLVSTVRPGSSSGPCIIHVITRTQVVQLRAKNRETQEEWLQALLLSMSLPLITKTIKPHQQQKKFLVYGSSLDNITFTDKTKDYESEWTLTTKLDVRKRQMSGNYYGGSLDTAIWTKKCRPIRTPSPNIPKAKMLEKIIGFSNENDINLRYKNSRLSLCSEEEMQYVGNDEMETGVKCKVHDENRNHDLYSVVDKRKKRMTKTLSDTELNKKPETYRVDFVKNEHKDKSPFGRIRHVFRLPRDKTNKSKSDKDRGREPRKRRQSFLQKVFKRKDYEIRDCESDLSDPLYDTIEFIPEQPRSVIPVVFQEEDKIASDEERSHTSMPIEEPQTNEEPVEQTNVDPIEEPVEKPNGDPPIYSQTQKLITGSKSILPANAMSELRSRLKSRESADKPTENDEQVEYMGKNEKPEEKAPSLPPRRMSRPVSPWHDVPTNNAPVTSSKPSFYVHKAIVKFHETNRVPHLKVPESEVSDLEDSLKIDLTEPKECIDGPTKVEAQEKKKGDDLSLLLEQLSKITVAPLAEPECLDDNYNSSSGSWNKSQTSDPDYDIPRPHKPLSILISQGKEIINSTEFMGKSDNLSDTSSSFRSMEPDSLEMAEKVVVQT